MVSPLDLAGIVDPELRASFELCDRVHRESDTVTHFLVSAYLPGPKQPYAHALYGFLITADRLADEGEPGAFAEWEAASLREVAAGHSDHPLRRAFVHTLGLWELDPALVADFLAATGQDAERTAPFATFEELRVFLRGVAGIPARLLLPVLEPVRPSPAASALMSLLGEVFQLIDIFRDFAADLAAGRCYLPAADVDRFGVRLDGTTISGDIDGLHALQAGRARRMMDEGSAVVDLVHPSSRSFLTEAIAACHAYLDQISRRGERIPAASDGSGELPRPRMPAIPGRAAGLPAIPPDRLPRHIAVIMDGNGRWARRRGRPRLAGHVAAEHAVRDLVEAALDLGLRYVSAFAFSTENWSRPADEVAGLMALLARRLPESVDWLRRQGVRVRWAGRRDRVPDEVRAELETAERLTAGNDRLTVIICLDYGGRAEITHAARCLARDAAAGRVDVDSVREQDFSRYLYLPDVPDVDLIVRTSGEQRISNFLLWQSAYAELMFEDVLWPDVDRRHLWRALEEFAARDRRFGAVPVVVNR
jgi:undecaprenyl diphosphate synthase